MKRKVKTHALRTLALFLTFLMVVYLIPTAVYADLIEASSSAGDNAVSQTTTSGSASQSLDAPDFVIDAEREDENLREANVKQFLMNDGSYTMVAYPYEVHYKDENGEWQDIDNTLAESGSEFSTSDAKIKFSKKVTGNGSIFTLHNGSKKIEMSLIGAEKGVTGVVTNTSTEFDGTETQLQKMMTLDKLSSKILYADILDGVDLEYVLNGSNVKENIIVKEKKESYTYSFEMKLNDLTASLDKNIITLSDNDEVIYTIPAPYMFDASGIYSNDVIYSLTDGGNGKYTLTVTPSAEWINAESRVFPVTIDPPLESQSNMGIDISVATIIDDYPSDIYMNTMSVGHREYNEVYRSYIKLTGISSDLNIRNVTEVMLGFKQSSFIMFEMEDSSIDTEELPILLCPTDEWGENLRWNTQPSIKSTRIASNSANGYATGDYCYWDITEIFQEEIIEDDGAIYFRALTVNDYNGLSDNQWRSFSIKDGPVLTLRYQNKVGLESYYTTSDQSVGFAGNGYVNTSTGELSFVINTLSTKDHLFSTGFPLVYNSAYAGDYATSSNFNLPYATASVGKGFKLGIHETIVPYEINGITYYIYTDSDGTEHMFKYYTTDTYDTYIDMSGLNLTLQVDQDNSLYRIIDTVGNTYSYHLLSDGSYKGCLVNITDKNGNALIIDVGTNLRPERIKVKPYGSTEILQTSIIYNTSGLVQRVYDPNTYEAYLFYYSSTYNGTSLSQTSNGYLRRIIYAKGTSTTTDSEWASFVSGTTGGTITKLAEANYTYDIGGRLTVARDELHNIEMRYSYDYEYKVSSVVEYAGESTLTHGQTLNFTYNDSSTSVRSSGTDDIISNTDDIVINYVYDSIGRTVTVYSTDTTGKKLYGASAAQYVDNVEKAKNSVKAFVSTSGTYSNYLKNGGFEAYSGNTFTNWTSSGTVINNTNNDYPDTKSAKLTVSSSVSSSSISQTVTLPAGDFSLSFKADSTNTENNILTAKVVKASDSSVIASKEYPINTEYQTPGEIEYTLCFTTTVSDSYNIIISLTAETGVFENSNVVLDDVMLSKSNVAASYSSVEDGGFENSVTKWTQNSGSISYVSGDTTFGKSIVVGTGSYTTVEQVIYSETYYVESVTNPTQYAQYTLFGWLKNNSGTYLDANPKLKVIATYYEQTEPIIYSYDFAKDVQNWQYGSVGFILDPELGFLTELKIVLEYSGVCGSVLFDDIVLLKNNNNSISYNYNTNGFVTDSQSGERKVYYRYTDNVNGDVELAIDSFGTITGYVYDTHRRVETEITYKYQGYVSPKSVYDSSLSKYQDLIIGAVVNQTQKELYITGYTTYEYNDYGQCESTITYAVKEIVDGVCVGNSKVYYKKGNTTPPIPVAYNEALLANVEYLSSSTEYNTTAGSFMFGAVTSETDTRGKITTYFYDSSTGYLSATISPEGYGTAYTYDTLGNIEYVLPAEIATNGYTSSNTGDVQYVYDDANRLEKIKTETTEYVFSYDSFGNTTGITASGSTLATYVYNNYNGKLNEIDYGNGFKVKYLYDALDRIKEIQYNINGGSTFSTAYRYEYGALGEVIGIYDVVNNKSILNEYDPQGRVIKTVYASGDVTVSGKRVSYDDQSRVAGVRFNFDDVRTGAAADSYVDIGSYYSYNDKGELSSATVKHNDLSAEITPNYDNLGRTSSKETAIEYNSSALGTLTNNYVFYNGSYLVSDATTSVTIGSSSTATELTNLKYYYDDNGNITEITTASGQIQNKYHYDEKGQLEREDNLVLNASYKWEYDDAGNITAKKTYAFTTGDLGTPISTISYGYAPGTDKLTSYNGQSITYDSIGNPLTYKGNTLTWKNGRELATYGNYSFTYDANGIRIGKTNGTTVTNYIVDGSTVLRQSWTSGSNSYVADYIYSESGTPLAFALSTNGGDYVYYFYETNIHGDITAVYDSSWNKIVSFSYDAWGNFTPTIHNSTIYTSNFQKAILFRYRGYIYDTETGFYYVSSRYYDPEIGRWINADGFVSTGQDITGYNMFAYCGNNPVNRKDPTGQFWITALIVTAVAVVCTVALSGCSAQPTSDVGAAKPYVDMPESDDPTSPNCYAYAIGSPVNEQPGGASGRIPTKWNDVNDVGKSVEADLKAKGHTVRKISGPDAKVYDNEFKIALRVGTQPYAYNQYTGQLYYDYHFMRQTNTGQWAEKHGYGGASILWDAGMTPDTIPWTLGGVPYYDSAIIYYAVGN